MAGVGNKVFGGKLLSKSMTGRIVLSHVHVLHCGGRGVLRSSFPLAWLAEELSRWNKLKIL